MTKVNKIQQHN